ncbi:MAG TPA: hydrophobe/amphiphile efflux-1 family RND transporter [Lentisphaeria bacterium]|nr:MAG: RND transporter [Lentisphaerae bacterium GWF2_38_69]HBM17106.1 hydrophobe/amphiphile efflux-1 family RND transporter [Lentisphaeria bacterium]
MFSKFFIHRPKFAFVISIVIVIAGLISIQMLPIAEFPEITPPQVSVCTSYPGADSETVEQTIIVPLEQQINGVEDMIYMVSQSTDDGMAQITISFEVGSDPDMNTVNVNNCVNIALAQLPENVQREGITVKQKNSNILLLINLYSPDDSVDTTFLSNFATLNFIDEMSRLSGVGQVNILGAHTYAMRIWLNVSRMASLKVTVADIINALNEQNYQVPGGAIGASPTYADQQIEYTLLVQSRLTEEKEFENIIIREKPDGSMIRMRDIATIELGAQSYSSFALLNGKSTAAVAVYTLPGANDLKVAKEIKGKMTELAKTFPSNVAWTVIYDTTLFVDKSISEVIKTLFIAVLLVILVVFIFLQDWRATLVPTVAIPVSLIGTFAVLLAMGFSINTITLFGMILAIGIVVDDAIVVVENVFRIMEEEHMDPINATIKSMEQVTGPVVATTMVLMAVFVPVAFIPGITGELYRQFAVTIAVAVAISAVNALTLSPALCATILKPSCEHKKKFIFFKWFNSFFDTITKAYNKCVSVLIRKLLAVTVFFVLLIIAMAFIYISLPTGFIPNEDQGNAMVEVMMPTGTALERTGIAMEKARKIIQETKGISSTITVPGFSIINQATVSNGGIIFIVLDDWDERKSSDLQIDAICNELKRKLATGVPEGFSFVFQLPPIPGLGSTGGFQFELEQKEGNNPQALMTVLQNFIVTANQQPELSGIFSTYISNVPKFKVDVDIDKVKKLGIPLMSVFNTISAYYGSYYVNQFNKFGKIYQVLIQAQKEYRSSLKNVLDTYISNVKGQAIPVNTFMSLRTVVAPEIITHYNMFANAEIQGSSAPGYSTGEAIEAMERVAAEVLPDNMQYEWTGTAYQEIIAGNKTIIIFILALTFIYLFLVAKYESWMLSISVMLSVPVAVCGAIIALWILHIDNNIYTQVGLVLLFGMATKTAILIVEFADVQHKAGKSVLESAAYAGHVRFRAVVMTAVAFILGVFPLVIATGPGAISRRALGTAVFGGMLLAAILGTLLIPYFYVAMEKILDLCSRKKDKVQTISKSE